MTPNWQKFGSEMTGATMDGSGVTVMVALGACWAVGWYLNRAARHAEDIWRVEALSGLLFLAAALASLLLASPLVLAILLARAGDPPLALAAYIVTGLALCQLATAAPLVWGALGRYGLLRERWLNYLSEQGMDGDDGEERSEDAA